MWDDIRNLAAGGVTILLTTQYLDEADELADRIAVLDHGRIVAEGTPDELKRRTPGGHIRLRLADPQALRAAAALFPGATPDEERLTLRVSGNGDIPSLRHVLAQLDDARIAVQDLSIHSADLDDVFFAVTGQTSLETGGSVMSTLAYTVSDSTTMFRRNVRRLRRYPSLTLLLIGMPIVFLLLFVYVFGGQLGHGLGNQYLAGHSGRAGYLNYVTPGILLMTVAAAVQGTAIVVAMDMTGGIIDRFRTMAIARSAVLTGHVLASLIQALLSVGIVLGVAVALGFRPEAGVLDWLAAIGLVTLFAFALIWLATALGLAAKSVETASNTPMFLTFLPFLGSGFVLVASLPAGLRQFAHYQPFTPTTETLRGLLTGTPIGTNAVVAVAWCVAIALGSYLWARHLYATRRSA